MLFIYGLFWCSAATGSAYGLIMILAEFSATAEDFAQTRLIEKVAPKVVIMLLTFAVSAKYLFHP